MGPNLFSTRDRFHGRRFFHRQGWDGLGMIQVRYIYCALYFYYYYISSTSDQQALHPGAWGPLLESDILCFFFFCVLHIICEFKYHFKDLLAIRMSLSMNYLFIDLYFACFSVITSFFFLTNVLGFPEYLLVQMSSSRYYLSANSVNGVLR